MKNKYIQKIFIVLKRNCDIISLVISFAALLIAIQSYILSSNQADLHFAYQSYMTATPQYWDGNGSLTFIAESNNNSADHIYADIFGPGKEVSSNRPGGEVDFVIENRGTIAAKNLLISIRFENATYTNSYQTIDEGLGAREGWKLLEHNHGTGGWQEIRWEPGSDIVLHPGVPIHFPEIPFHNAYIANENAKMHVIISADNAPMKKFTIPLKVEETIEY